MGLSPAELEDITPYEFNLLMEGYNERELAEERRTRSIVWMIYCSIPKEEGHENQSMYELFPLPGDPAIIPDSEKKEYREIDAERKAAEEALMNSIK